MSLDIETTFSDLGGFHIARRCGVTGFSTDSPKHAEQRAKAALIAKSAMIEVRTNRALSELERLIK